MGFSHLQENIQIALEDFWQYFIFVLRRIQELSYDLQVCLSQIWNQCDTNYLSAYLNEVPSQLKKFIFNTWQSHPTLPIVIGMTLLLVIITLVNLCTQTRKTKPSTPSSSYLTTAAMDLAKVSYDVRIAKKLKKILTKYPLDINKVHQESGLSLFLSACLAANKDVINWLLRKGADINVTSADGDSAVYLATFGLLNSPSPDLGVLKDLVNAGCDVNLQNQNGFTPLHRAASKGNLPVIECLKSLGSDVYITNNNGIYPLDSAINAGHVEAAESLKISLNNTSLWEIIEPHTPMSVRLGLQSPRTKHLAESTFMPRRPKVN